MGGIVFGHIFNHGFFSTTRSWEEVSCRCFLFFQLVSFLNLGVFWENVGFSNSQEVRTSKIQSTSHSLTFWGWILQRPSELTTKVWTLPNPQIKKKRKFSLQLHNYVTLEKMTPGVFDTHLKLCFFPYTSHFYRLFLPKFLFIRPSNTITSATFRYKFLNVQGEYRSGEFPRNFKSCTFRWYFFPCICKTECATFSFTHLTP